ncbi:MAG: alkaline phosphatase family protein [Candidatus Kapabacteria bacterium]|nr:alkaline phosphatase family protein [Candidatus Kapabacteria bacterium]
MWAQAPKPRLVVVVSYDQYRGDYPPQFARFASSRGFERIRREGTVFANAAYNHASLMTGPGHATILSGMYPYRNGIVANNFCDARLQRCLYCAEDTSHGLSAATMLVPTLGDRLRRLDPRHKNVGIALKDRAAILMAGMSATTALWFDEAAGGFTTSSAYRKPAWLPGLNTRLPFTAYQGRTWRAGLADSLDPAIDDVMGEGTMSSGRRSFPHRMPMASDSEQYVADFVRSPYSVEYLFAAAVETIRRDALGADSIADVLAIGVSTTDFLGHTFGPDSREVQELYRACDTILASFIDALDTLVGRTHYVLVVTSDHGVAPIPEVIRNAAEAQGTTIDAGRIRQATLRRAVDSALTHRYGGPDSFWVERILEPALYLDTALCQRRNIDIDSAAAYAAAALLALQGMEAALPSAQLSQDVCPEGLSLEHFARIKRSFRPDRCGHVVLFPKRYWIFGSTPATHGTYHDYDRSVPLMFFGGGVGHSTVNDAASPVDIAPTLGRLLGLSELFASDEADGVAWPLVNNENGSSLEKDEPSDVD